jgi:formylglycine-generating enzyme required for sulfatase activity
MKSLSAAILVMVLHVTLVQADTKPSPIGEIVTNSFGMKLKRIKSGSFPMGNPVKEAKAAAYPEHRVRIRNDFYIGVTEVTQDQWFEVMGTRPWRARQFVEEDRNFPATWISWNDAVSFCKRLSKKEGVTYRLPTEAEWEYACRGGTTTMYSFGDDESALRDYAWFADNAYFVNEKYAHSVATKKPNSWGLYDMHGNVYEWCQDRFGEYENSPTVDPSGPQAGSFRIFRGGHWNSTARQCQSSYRSRSLPTYRVTNLGFRVVRVLPTQPAPLSIDVKSGIQ